MYRLTHRLRVLQTQHARAAVDGLTLQETRVLGYFARHGGGTQSELAAHSGRDRAQIARVVGRLRELDLLQADPAGEDRRQIQLRLSPQGQDLWAALSEANAQLSARITGELSAQERQQLTQLLGKLLQALPG
ncbi:MarR family transcriptional regulator [Pelomonas sp. HMWF004]|nr:MarR family transcriptional regulator [Pelomonas sp. HMWF004]